MLFRCVFFFFFKQKTAYEMRISDWSSDVCSSDLFPEFVISYRLMTLFDARSRRTIPTCPPGEAPSSAAAVRYGATRPLVGIILLILSTWALSGLRSDERRVGKEWVSTGKYRGSPYHKKKKDKHTTIYRQN